ncbi:antitoxin HicB [Agromyces mangrovi Wang et al. 2018]|uniref:antitoxin HicB n=1 Tax=Agromyces mangrovi TaxID=1858653 RepID=UPI002573B67F|nr:antitoxin HicB [Agromyces mangrovi]BDZ63317.1 hypothetical protein GCM10025877_02550 [Agromyces mangrovi]
MYTADDYVVRVEHHYGEYVGLVSEFPSLSNVADTRAEAEAGMRALLADVLRDLVDSNEHVPTPLISA